jgi:cardiolipin synthase A/B
MLYTLFNKQEYLAYLIQRYKAAGLGDRIILATMEFRPDQYEIKQLVEAMQQAAKQGAHVQFMVDAYSFMLKDSLFPGPLYFSKRDPDIGYGTFKPVVEALHSLRKSGVHCEVINKPGRAFKNPFGGRSHIKFAVINGESFVGGCNLSQPEQLDVMVKIKDTGLANYLSQFTHSVFKYRHVRKALGRKDQSYRINQNTELLIDAGVKRQSLIYDRAYNLITRAGKRVYMTCQYFPNINMPAMLTKAHYRGVGVHLAYNHPDQHRAPIRGIQKRTVAIKKKTLPKSVFENQLEQSKKYLHAKILLSEKEAIVGSHNFVKMGVNLGTAEIALHSTAPEFVDAARAWVKNL